MTGLASPFHGGPVVGHGRLQMRVRSLRSISPGSASIPSTRAVYRRRRACRLAGDIGLGIAELSHDDYDECQNGVEHSDRGEFESGDFVVGAGSLETYAPPNDNQAGHRQRVRQADQSVPELPGGAVVRTPHAPFSCCNAYVSHGLAPLLS